MLNEFHITNFKSFGGPVSIPLKPITLIFGPNSSGKSSIFQSLLLLKQTMERVGEGTDTNLVTNGNLVDLGSFRDFISHHDESLSFTFKANLKAHSIEHAAMILNPDRSDYVLGLHKHIQLLEECVGMDSVGISISFSFDFESCKTLISYVDLYIGQDLKPLITYKRTNWDQGAFSFEGNFSHEFWKKYWELFDSKNPEKLKEILKDEIRDLDDPHGTRQILRDWKSLSREVKEKLLKELKSKTESRLFPEFHDQVQRTASEGDSGEPLNEKSEFSSAVDLYRILFECYSIGFERIFPRTLNKSEIWDLADDNAAWDQSRDPSMFLISAGVFLEEFLKGISYIGPLRNYPNRYYRYTGENQNSVGMYGEMAPNMLLNNEELISKVNYELGKFGSGFELALSKLRDEESNINELFSLKLYDKSTGSKANIRDVGFGLSQVLPIIVQSVMAKNRTILIEQPELHLHPGLQAELGDMFIESALGEQENRFIIETHSEHLILRLLRRIRETANDELPEGIHPIKPDQISVLYVQPTEKGSQVIQLPVDEEGEFLEEWPQGFFEEREEELLY
jgi:predicted ATPase